MATLKEIVRHEVEQYAGESLNATLYAVIDDVHQIYTVISVGQPADQYPPRTVIMARVVGNHIIIEADTTNKPLVEALQQAGLARPRIILAYAGEVVPVG